MIETQELWLQILLSGVAVFFLSSLLHMVLPLHKSDYGHLPGEDAILEAMRAGGVKPGHYMFPYCMSMQEYTSDEFMAKLKAGPVGFMTVKEPAPVNMGKQLGTWFLFTLFVGTLCAYLTGMTTAPGAEFTDVLRRVSVVAFAGYALGSIPESIWKGLSWTIAFKFVFDGTLYALATGAVFAAMWPAAV